MGKRSKWKKPYIKVDKNKDLNSTSLLTISRSSKIIPKFIGLTFKVYNGKKFADITVNKEMIGYKFGEFVSTRAKFVFKKKNKK